MVEPIITSLQHKMRRTRHGSGNNRTRGYHSSLHRHENKRVRIEERALKSTRKKDLSFVDKPMPLIDIGIDRIDQLIKSVIDPKFEDAIQDVWLKVIEEHIDNEETILQIATDINHTYSRKSVDDKYRLVSLDTAPKGGDGKNEIFFKDLLTLEKLERSKVTLGRNAIDVRKAKRKRELRRKTGLCSCGREPSKGYARCIRCLENDRKKNDAKVKRNSHTRQLRKDLGLCVNCGREPLKGYTRCTYCLAMARLHMEIYHRKHPRGRGLYRKRNHNALDSTPRESDMEVK